MYRVPPVPWYRYIRGILKNNIVMYSTRIHGVPGYLVHFYLPKDGKSLKVTNTLSTVYMYRYIHVCNVQTCTHVYPVYWWYHGNTTTVLLY